MAVKLVPLKSVMIVRDGRRVSPPVGKAYPFSTEERDAMREDIDYRKAVNEDAEADENEVVPERNSPHVKTAKTNAKGAGNTTAMADGFDGAPTTEGEEPQTSDSNKAGAAKTPAQAKPKGSAAAADDDL